MAMVSVTLVSHVDNVERTDLETTYLSNTLLPPALFACLVIDKQRHPDTDTLVWDRHRQPMCHSGLRRGYPDRVIWWGHRPSSIGRLFGDSEVKPKDETS